MAEERLQIHVDEKGTLVVKRKLEGLGKSAQKAGGGVKLLRTALGGLATVGLGAVLASSVKTMAAFSQEMSTVKAITKATETQFEDLQSTARDLGATTRFSASQAAEGMTFLARAGFKTNQVMAAIGPTLQLAQAGALGLGRAADIASNVLTGFRIAADDAARVIDVLALAANSANTDVSQLGEAMSYVAPVASSLSVSLEETAAAVQVLSDAGIQASRAGTNLTMVMRLLEAPTRKQQGVLAKLGLTADDVRVSQVGLTGALEKLKDSGADTGDMFKFFGRSAAAASVLLEGTTEKMDRFHQANLRAKGTAAEVAEVMDDNLNGALLAVRSAWEELQLAFGASGPQSALTQGLKGLADVLRTVAANIEVASTATVSLAIAIAAIKWSAFLQGITTSAGALALFNKGLIAAKASLAALAINPITVGLVALAAAITAVTFAFDKYKKMQDEVWAIEERTYKMRLAHVQARVKEIQQRNAATASLEEYIKKLELENKFLGYTEEKQEEQITLFRALEIAQRPLTKLEEERVRGLLAEKNAIQAANDRRQQEQELLTDIKQPAQEYAHQLSLLNALQAQGSVTAKEYTDTLAAIREEYGQMGHTQGSQYLENLAKENELLKLNSKEREVQRALMAAQSSMGANLTQEQADSVRALVEERQALTATNYLDQLRQENELLALNSEEQEKQRALMAAEAELGAPLNEAQKATVLNLTAENQALSDKQALLAEIKGPQDEYNRQHEALNMLLKEGSIDSEEYKTKLQELDESIKKSVVDTASVMDDMWGSVWNNAGSALDQFVETGKLSFSDLAMSIVKDIQKIVAKQMMMMAFKAMGIPVPGFAQGGEFTVSGNGGIDSQLVAFKATPGEHVDITRPGDQRDEGGTTVVQSAPPVVKILNLFDQEEIREAMSGPEGDQIIINALRRNKDTARQVMS